MADSLLAQLDSVIEHRGVYLDRKEKRIGELRAELLGADSERGRFEAYGHLYGEYLPFNTDSAYRMSVEQEAIARKIGDKDLIANAILNKANILSAVGMYHETLSLIDTISSAALPDYLRPYYYHTKRTVYGNLADYAAFEPGKSHYERLTDAYRDSLLMVNDPESIFHILIKADQLNVHHKPREAIGLLEGFIQSKNLPEHDRAICAWTLSESYAELGDVASQKEQLLISAISDMKSAVLEYVSLRQLAWLLYQEGDLDRAYRFLNIAVDDAAKCNARQRIVELNDLYPMINGIYVDTVHEQKNTLEYTIIIITVLSVILICLLFYTRKQMVRIAEARRRVEDANNMLSELNGQLSDSNSRLNELNVCLRDSNGKLNELNHQLLQSNAKLQEAYKALAENSELKEVYICRYMDQSLEYIELLDGYRKSVGKLVNGGKAAELQKLVKSTKIIDDELKAFYAKFDETFLGLFPTFVEDFNRLLQPEEAILPKKAGALTSELRIFALIRLGITDSDKIAKFLRYSLTTIYNYRTKVRNKAKCDRNSLEREVAKIGRG
ncbi:MAG: DUF6377 domain-containing protein [Muribaculaceae bacterium]|nr:DUF6377 domain-containing protein [Muribaculaceae bacterium]